MFTRPIFYAMSDSPTNPDDNRNVSDSDRRMSDTNRDDRAGTDRTGTDRTDRTGTDRTGTDRTDQTGTRGDRTRTDTGMREGNRGNRDGGRSDMMKYMSGLASLIGLWIAASPFVYEATETALWNNLAVGSVIFLLAGYNYYRLTKQHRIDVGAPSLVALLGLWSLVAPFLLAYGSDSLVWSTMVSGLIVAALAGYNAYRSRETETTTTTGARA